MVHVINQEKCVKCGTCLDACPVKFNAIVKVSGETVDVPQEPIPVKAEKPKATAA
jgi:NADH-quinone oxidoreductase subunit F